jgi:hypothetical protein
VKGNNISLVLCSDLKWASRDEQGILMNKKWATIITIGLGIIKQTNHWPENTMIFVNVNVNVNNNYYYWHYNCFNILCINLRN